MARPGLDKHVKFRRLVRILGEPEPHVRGYLELLWEVGYENGDPVLLATARTNADGRTDVPLLEGGAFVPGVYEIVFAVGGYFAAADAPDPPFLDRVPVRFGVAEAGGRYHVPLLVSPGAYSTYRGS